MPTSAALVSALRLRGIAAVISGAGSSVLALATADQPALAAALCPPGWECAVLAVSGGAHAATL
jgi:homoserine kinase